MPYVNQPSQILSTPYSSTSITMKPLKTIVRQEKPDVLLTHGSLVIIAKALHEVPIVAASWSMKIRHGEKTQANLRPKSPQRQ